MTDAFATIDGHRLASLRMVAANTGPWFAELDLEEAPTVGRRVAIAVGALQLSGTLIEQQSGSFAARRRCRVVGGAGGWSTFIKARNYHSDAGVKARLVAEDVAREVGETLGDFVPAAERLGRDYVRQAGLASRVLEDVAGADVPWWVDYAGLTQVGPRPATIVDASAYQLLSYDPRGRIATLAVDDPSAIAVGATVLSERLEAPQIVRELTLHVTTDGMRIVVWCGGGEAEAGRLAGLLVSIARRATDRPLLGLYRYRVVAMAADGRCELQAVRKIVGLPDVMPVSQWPGAPGVYAELAPSAEVLVSFIEGDRSQPIVTHYAGPDGVGFVPAHLYLGGASGAPAARQGDAVEVLLPPAIFVGTVQVGGSPAPATGVMTWGVPKALGVITAGSAKVGIAS